MTLSSLFRDWILDPAGFLFLLTLVLLVLPGLFRWRGKWHLIASLVWISAALLFSAPKPVNTLLMAWEMPIDETPACLASQVLVVIGGGIDKRAQSENNIERLQRSTLIRVAAAGRISKLMPESTLIVSGGVSSVANPDVSEAGMMSQFLLQAGIAQSRILLDAVSQNTYQNAVNVKLLLEANGLVGDIALVTSALHMRRAEAAFSKQGITVCPVAVDQIGIANVPTWAWMPQTTALVKFDKLLHEWLASVFYLFSGKV